MSCRRASVRLHYARNRQYYVDKARARQQRVVAETRYWLIGYLETHPCVDCGITDIRVLEFDHRDPTTKAMAVAVLARGGLQPRPGRLSRTVCRALCQLPPIRTYAQRGWWGAGSGAAATKITGRARQDSNLQPPDP